MNKKKGMTVLLIAAVSIIAAVVSFRAYNKKKRVGKPDITDSTNNSESDSFLFDNRFDPLLESEIEDDQALKEKRSGGTVLRLENRSWWDVSSTMILSYLFIITIAGLVVLLSVFSHSAYKDRKESEQKRIDSLWIQKKEIDQLSLEKEEARKLFLEAKLDSIDFHIQALKPVVKPTPKNKQQKK